MTGLVTPPPVLTEFRYCPMHELGRRLAEGWTLVDDFAGMHHGAYSVLIGRPENPVSAQEIATQVQPDPGCDDSKGAQWLSKPLK